MGDVGYLEAPANSDSRNERFWFCGRKSHRVITPRGTMFTIPCEAMFNQHPAIYRSALVGVGPRGGQRPVVIAEPWPEKRPASAAERERLIAELQEIAQRHPHTAEIRDVFLMDSLPVDIRHNAKIFREQLAQWAARRLGA